MHLSPKVNTKKMAFRISSVMHKDTTAFDIFSVEKSARDGAMGKETPPRFFRDGVVCQDWASVAWGLSGISMAR